jgi:LPS-assembly protein
LTLFVAFASLTVARAEISASEYWGLCPVEPLMPPQPTLAGSGVERGSIQLTSDDAELRKEGVSVFSGNVELVRDDQALQSDKLTYDEQQGLITFEGDARYWSRPVYWDGARGVLEFDNDIARLHDGRYVLRDRNGRGNVGTLMVDTAKDSSRLEDVDYTTCPSGTPAWQLAADSIRLDHVEEWGTADNVVLRVRGVPVFYIPRMTFPLSDRRKTGFLTPSVGNSTDSGIDVNVPFYWNIAPAMDATITPRVLTDRGFMVGSELRYLTRNSNGEVGAEILPSDSKFGDEARGLVSFTHNQTFPTVRSWTNLIFNYVSDKEYFEDLGTNLSLTSTRFLERRGDFYATGDWWWLLGRVHDYQTVDQNIIPTDRPYTRLPQLYVFARAPLKQSIVDLTLQGESTYFDRDAGVIGGRIDLYPQLALQWRRAAGFFVPKLGIRHTQYFLEDQAGPEDDPARTVPTFSLDSGIFLEREYDFAGRTLLSTIEPRIYYLYIPEVGQDEFPVFDTGRLDFSYWQMFTENRFSGTDRIADANQVSVGIETQLLETRSGIERLRASFGQVFYFEDREVTLPGFEEETDSASEMIVEFGAHFTDALSITTALQWDPNESQTEKGSVRVRYNPNEYAVLNLEYRIRRAITDIEQTDVSFRWPLTRRWSAIGRWNYSLQDEETLEVVGGFEYNSCCWGVRAAARRFLRNVNLNGLLPGADRQFDTGIFLQFELKGLAGLGNTASFLQKVIPGYASEF